MGIAALVVFIAVTVIMNTALKREISESLVVALIATALLGGTHAPAMLGKAVFWCGAIRGHVRRYGFRVHGHCRAVDGSHRPSH